MRILQSRIIIICFLSFNTFFFNAFLSCLLKCLSDVSEGSIGAGDKAYDAEEGDEDVLEDDPAGRGVLLPQQHQCVDECRQDHGQ